MVPSEFSHYRILSRLGRGGMGEVFLGEDVSLDRKVALKFLLTGSDDSANRRLLREARAAAHLDHPFICKVYEVGEHHERPFLAMEYVEGETLKDRLTQGRLTVNETVRIGGEIAEALHFAHSRDVIHRDLKPANVMLGPDDHVKVMDFGIAKRLTAPVAADAATIGAPTGTLPGDLTGTLAYMSPEQVRGQAVDQRSDVFAFGVLLSELLTGTHPFMRSSMLDTAHAILNDPPQPLEQSVPGAPPLLAHIVGRCLEKDRDRRYSSLGDVRIELDSLATAGATPGSVRPRKRTRWIVATALGGIVAVTGLVHWVRPLSFLAPEPALAFKERDWIVVADFNNLTGDPVFDSSLRLALEVAIAQSQYVNVYPQDRVIATLRRMQRDPAGRLDETQAVEVAVRDHVGGVLACDIAQLGNVYSITARLVDPQTRVSVLRDSVQADGKSAVLGALDRLATQVRSNLGESLSALSDRSRPLPHVTTASLDALKMYAESLRVDWPGNASHELLRQAVALDPDFALAHAELGRRYYLAQDRETRKEGEKHFQTALKLADRLTLRERLWIQASAEDARGNRERAVEAFHAYLAQYPDDTNALFRLAWTQMAGLQQSAEAVESFKRILELNPRDANASVNIATAYANLGDYESSIPAYQKAFELAPSLVLGVFINHEYGFTLVRIGRLDEAAAVFERMKTEAQPGNRARGFRCSAFLRMYRGHYAAAIKEIRQAIAMNQTHKSALSEYRDRLILQTALVATGQIRESGTEWPAVERLIATQSLSPEWLWRPAKVLVRGGRPGEATRLLGLMQKTLSSTTAASAANRSTTRDQAFIDLVVAELDLAAGRVPRALEGIERAHLALNESESLESLAVALLVAGRLSEAVSRYEELLRRPRFGLEAQEVWFQTHLTLGRLYERQSRIDDARRVYASLVERWKGADENVLLLRSVRKRLEELPVAAITTR